jgi:hypothetical protein
MPLQASARWIKAAAKINYGTIQKVAIQGKLIGKKCWKVTVSYGELTLHLGSRLPYENARMAGEKKGEWIFSTCGTEWILVTPDGVVQPADGTEEIVEEQAKAIEGTKLIDFGVTWPKGSVVLGFSNGCHLLVEPTSNDSKFDLPFWQFFMPKDKVMSFGPGPKLSVRRADLSA